ncbi:hypothetical protein BLNAU_17726 [Blattamonas nauphoetae]|uniref:Uncharacterized protein n=1 Tax=Blattamonas nauphoetae TaxID=2049346 RepID=A0ABQ9X6E1_9EUKA|nr:hypothetical protein BLNAU_17726 [Blattamonas nauphoetae]
MEAINQKIISSDDYSPFLTWDENDGFSAVPISKTLMSLVSMIRDGYHFDEMLHRKAALFLSVVIRKIHRIASPVRMAVGQDFTNPAEVAFHRPILHFLRSSHIPLISQSLSSKVENEFTILDLIRYMAEYISRRRINGYKFHKPVKEMIRMLNEEGQEDLIEQKMMNDDEGVNSIDARTYAFQLNNLFGLNAQYSFAHTYRPRMRTYQ